jgi:transposase-like protein
LTGGWVPHDTRDAIIDFTKAWSEKTEIPLTRFISWLSVAKSKFYNWIERYGKVNEHNAPIPRDFWLEDWERQAIISFCLDNPLEGYRRLTFMMLDSDVVAVSPVTTWRVLSKAGLLAKWNKKKSLKGTGFVQPLLPHEHWHVDISYINIHGTFYYLCCLLDGCSRYIVHWEIRERMTEADVEIVLQRAKEKFPDARPRIISDNGPQFVARDFKEFIRISGMTHVRTSPFYPQSNGKLERFHQTIKDECIRPGVPLSLDDAKRIVGKYIEHYNTVRLHSSIGYVAPADKLNCRDQVIFKERDRKLEEARELRKQKRQKARPEFNISGEADLPLNQAV